MLKLNLFNLILGLCIGGIACTTTEKNYSPWFFYGSRDAGKDATVVKMSNNATNAEVAFISRAVISLGSHQDCNEPKKISNNTALPLVNLGSSHYYFGMYFKTNFFKAMQFCKDHGMDLLSIESADENTRIFNYLDENYKKLDHFWTSGSDLGEEGNFVWLSTGKSLKYTYWSTPQPDNAGKIEHCLEIWKIGDKHYIWNDIPCANQYNFICEVQNCREICKK